MRAALLARARSQVAGLDARIGWTALAVAAFIGARASTVAFAGIFLVNERGIPAPVVGIAFLVESLMRGLAAPLFGALSDRYGRRVVFVAGGLAPALLMPAILLVRDPATLLLWSVLVGLAQAPFFPAAFALLLDLAPPERRQSVLALNYTGISVGYTLFVLPAGFLAQSGFAALVFAACVAFVLVAVIGLVPLAGPLPAEAALEQPSLLAAAARALRDPSFRLLSLVAFLLPMGLGLIALVLPLYAVDSGVPQSVMGALLAVNGLLVAALAVVVNARIERSGPFGPLAPAAVLVAASFAPLAAAGSVPSLLLAIVAFSFGEIVFQAALPAAVASLAPPGARGSYQGAWSLVTSFAIGSAFFASGLARDSIGWAAYWALMCALTLCAAIAFRALRPHFERTARERSPSAVV